MVARNASSSDLLALMQGFARLQVTHNPSRPVKPDEVFAAVEQARTDGSLHKDVSHARIRYEASKTHPGLLEQILADGQRKTGHFVNGEFIPASSYRQPYPTRLLSFNLPRD